MGGGRGRPSLPDADAAFVEPAKHTDDLLNPDHPVGGDMAASLARFGFRPETWPIFEAARLAHARSGAGVGERQTVYRRHDTVRGPLADAGRSGPDRPDRPGGSMGTTRPRFVTAHPGRRSGGRR